MPDLGHDLLFGAFVVPDARAPQRTAALARAVDAMGLDVLGVQDHPYQPGFLDTWTFLSTLADVTERVVLFPDVANLPLRPPAVLAKSAATLDLLSGGRVELGLGAGAFPDGVAALGGPRLAPREAVDALEEAVTVLRSLWVPGDPVSYDGTHYRLSDARPGPVPAHDIGIWLGSYGPRMLALTGRAADGWVPSSMYAAPAELPAMSARVDAAAAGAGRDPAAVRRWYNVAGSFTRRDGEFLSGPPRVWVEQLTELALELGFSAFVLAPGGAGESDLRRFADEVAPGVREAVAAARGTSGAAADADGPAGGPGAGDGGGDGGGQADLDPAVRTTGSPVVLDEATRPRLPQHTRAEGSQGTEVGRANAQALVQIHDHLRSELEQVRSVVEQVAAGQADPAAARSLINRMSMRQNYWSVGAFCAAYCRVLTVHHAIEDARMFPDLQAADGDLAPVLERLEEEHEVIAGVLTRLDDALVEMVTDPARLGLVQERVEHLADVLLSHLDYEESELLGPLARLSVVI